MKVNKNIWVGKNKPYNKNSLHFPNGINSGGSGESGGSNVEYIDLSGDLMLADILVSGIEEMKITVENAPFPVEGMVGEGIAIFTLADQLRRTGATVSIIAVSYNRDAAAIIKQEGVVTTQTAYETLVSKGESYVEAYNNAPRITKEEFYSLE